MDTDWYLERRKRVDGVAALQQTSPRFEYVLQQVAEAVKAGEQVYIKPPVDAPFTAVAELVGLDPQLVQADVSGMAAERRKTGDRRSSAPRRRSSSAG